MPEIELSLRIAKLLDELRKSGDPSAGEALNRLATQLASPFQARKEEVAILRVSADGKMLGFFYPVKLRRIGMIPLTATHSLAAKTIRDKRGEVINNFSVYKHASVFEAVDLSAGEKASPIQKIVSAPMIVDGKVVGVLQISRKGHPGVTIGRDFTPQDLSELTTAGTILGKFVASQPAPAAAPAKPAKS